MQSPVRFFSLAGLCEIDLLRQAQGTELIARDGYAAFLPEVHALLSEGA